MDDTTGWKTFLETGKVVDYLSYRGIAIEPEDLKTGESAFESAGNGDGDDLVGDTDW